MYYYTIKEAKGDGALTIMTGLSHTELLEKLVKAGVRLADGLGVYIAGNLVFNPHVTQIKDPNDPNVQYVHEGNIESPGIEAYDASSADHAALVKPLRAIGFEVISYFKGFTGHWKECVQPVSIPYDMALFLVRKGHYEDEQ